MYLFNELRRRNVLRIAVAYVVMAWLLIQVAETIFPLFGFDDTPARIVVIVLAIGLLPSLIFAWAFELTPEGLKKEQKVDAAQAYVPRTDKVLDRIIMVALALALGYFAFDKFVLSETREASIAEQARREGRSEGMAESLDDNSIAVLPFVNMSSDPEQEFFADGMTEEILNILAGVPGLRVTARTSSFFFKNQDLPVAEIAKALNVRHILEGSVRKSGNRVRITAQLIEAGSDRHMWSETYDRELKDVFEIQDEVAGSIAGALMDSFTGLDDYPVSRSDNLAAFEAYRTGRLLWWRRTPKDLHEAIMFFNKSIEYDPRFAPAYAAIADSWLLLGSYGDVQVMAARDEALPMIDKAFEIDPDSAEANAARGLAGLMIKDSDTAESSLRRAIEIDENYIPAYTWLGIVLGNQGRVAENGVNLQNALARDPLNEVLTGNYATNLMSRGDHMGAKNQIEVLLRLQPDSTTLLFMLSSIYGRSGQLAEAWKLAKRAYDLQPHNAQVVIAMAKAWMDLGDFDQADSVMYAGLESSHENVEFRTHYLFQLTMQNRVEAAEGSLIDSFGQDVSSLPAAIQRMYHYHAALISDIRGEPVQERNHLELAINSDETQLYNNSQIFILSTVSLLHSALGNTELAEQRLSTAERVVGHARLNGMDDAEIYYDVACLFALRGEKQRALQSLRQAYEKGWRLHWLLNRDKRLDSLRDEPAFQEIRQQISDDVARARETVSKLQLAG